MTQKIPKKTITRKKTKTLDDMSNEDRYNILLDYQSGKFTWDTLKTKYKLRSKNALEKWVNKYIRQLNIIKETSALNPRTEHYYDNFTPANLINEPFLDLLSPENSPSITEQEHTYCYLYVYTGNNLQALEESELNVGLTRNGAKSTASYTHAIRIRGMFLRKKTNVARFISQLRKEKLKGLEGIDKVFIVEELVQQLEQLKESGENRKLTLDTIKLLGQTCSAFTERIEIGEVDPSKSINHLVELAQTRAMKEADIKELSDGSDTQETWEVEK